VIRPIALVTPWSVNHMSVPFGAGEIAAGFEPVLRPALNSVISPSIVTRPIALTAPWSVNQTLPWESGAIPLGRLPAFRPALKNATAPVRLIVPILGCVPRSVNQRLSSPPIASAFGKLPAGSGYSVIVRLGVIRPIDGSRVSVNQMFPSAPTRIWRGKLPAGRLNSVNTPAVVTLPIALVVPLSFPFPWNVLSERRPPTVRRAPDADQGLRTLTTF